MGGESCSGCSLLTTSDACPHVTSTYISSCAASSNSAFLLVIINKYVVTLNWFLFVLCFGVLYELTYKGCRLPPCMSPPFTVCIFLDEFKTKVVHLQCLLASQV